jgi:hypothetical protein
MDFPRKFANWIVVFLVLITIPRHASDQSNKATQLIKVTMGMKDNYQFLKMIGPSVSNFGDEQDYKIYKRALQHQVETELLQLQMELGTAYEEMRRTQKISLELYYRILDANIDRVEFELIRLTKVANGLEKTQTHHYLQMGFRELAVAKRKLLIARNTHPQLFLIKLQDCSFALKSVKQAQKYIILLGLLHDGEYESEDEKDSFEAMKMEIQRVFLEKSDKYLRFHYDTNFMTYDNRDLFEEIWNKPDLEELMNPLPGIDDAYIRNPNLPKIPERGSE